MKITTTYDNNGARTDKIELSPEEEQTIAAAIDIIKKRCVAAGYPENYKDWNEEQWRLLGIMRFEGGCEATLNFANNAEISPYHQKQHLRAYA